MLAIPLLLRVNLTPMQHLLSALSETGLLVSAFEKGSEGRKEFFEWKTLAVSEKQKITLSE